MKSLIKILLLFSVFVFSDFNLIPGNLSTNIFVCHNPKKNLTSAAISLLESYKKLFKEKPICITDPNISYSVASTMPANQYVIFTSEYEKYLVSYASHFSTLSVDGLGTIWDSDPKSYKYWQACPADTILFPYPFQNGIHNLDYYTVKFVPIESFKKATLNGDWAYKDAPVGINLTEIKSIRDYYLENKNGYINKTFPIRYTSKFTGLGIICDVKLKTNKIVPCYLIGLEVSNNPTQWVLWKK